MKIENSGNATRTVEKPSAAPAVRKRFAVPMPRTSEIGRFDPFFFGVVFFPSIRDVGLALTAKL